MMNEWMAACIGGSSDDTIYAAYNEAIEKRSWDREFDQLGLMITSASVNMVAECYDSQRFPPPSCSFPWCLLPAKKP